MSQLRILSVYTKTVNSGQTVWKWQKAFLEHVFSLSLWGAGLLVLLQDSSENHSAQATEYSQTGHRHCSPPAK